MKFPTSVKDKLNKLLEELKSGEKKLYYCSFAEIDEKHPSENYRICMAIHLFQKDGQPSHIEPIIDAINQIGYLVSSEVLKFISFMLIDCNEFYYVGAINEELKRYFDAGNFSLVPILDRPYINAAAKIIVENYSNMARIYFQAFANNMFSNLEYYVRSSGCGTVNSTPLHKDKEEILHEIRKWISDYQRS